MSNPFNQHDLTAARCTACVREREIPPHRGCEDTTPPGAQTLSVVETWSYQSGIPPGSLDPNIAGQLNFVGGTSPSEVFKGWASIRDGFAFDYTNNIGLAGPYVGHTPMYQIIQMVGSSMAAAVPVPLVAPHTFQMAGQIAQSGFGGHYDVEGYLLTGVYDYLTVPFSAQVFFDNSNNVVYPMVNPVGFSRSAKLGNDFFRLEDTIAGVTNFYKWNLTTGVRVAGPGDLNANLLGPAFNICGDIQASTNFLWVLNNDFRIYGTFPPTVFRILQFDHNLNFVAAFDIANGASPFSEFLPWGMFVVSDDLIYLGYGTTANWGFAYFKPSTSTYTLIDGSVTPGGTQTPGVRPTGNSLIFNKGYLYINYDGDIDGTGGRVAKVGPLYCPGTTNLIGT